MKGTNRWRNSCKVSYSLPHSRQLKYALCILYLFVGAEWLPSWCGIGSKHNCTIKFENIVLKRGVPPVLCSLEKEKIVRSSVPISDWALLPQAHSGFWVLGAGNRGRNPALWGDGALIWGCAGCPTFLALKRGSCQVCLINDKEHKCTGEILIKVAET